MLPFLPALILLILQGPAGIERMAAAGQLPSALNALHPRVASMPEARSADDAAIASILAMTSGRDMSRALLQLLTWVQPEEPEQPMTATVTDERKSPIPVPPSLGAPSDGYFACRRSRDGPVSD